MWRLGVVSLIPWPLIIGQAEVPGGDATQIVTLATQIGLSGVFLWQWRDERRERRDNAATMIAFIQRFGPALENSTDSLERAVAVLANQVDKVAEGAAPFKQDNDLALRRLEMVVDDLRLTIKEQQRWDPEQHGERRKRQ